MAGNDGILAGPSQRYSSTYSMEAHFVAIHSQRIWRASKQCTVSETLVDQALDLVNSAKRRNMWYAYYGVSR